MFPNNNHAAVLGAVDEDGDGQRAAVAEQGVVVLLALRVSAWQGTFSSPGTQ